MARAGVLWGLLLLHIHYQCASRPNHENSVPVYQKVPRHPHFMAFLTSAAGGVVCAGAVVHERYVLTAAGCFVDGNGDLISYQHKVLVADDYKSIRQLLPHPAYRLQTSYYDVGLIRLSDKIRFGPGVSRIELVREEPLRVGAVMKTTCWMMDEKRSWLQPVPANIIMRSFCSSALLLGHFTGSIMVCARVHDICGVSSGSPLYVGVKLYGVASRQLDGQTLYTKVGAVRAWIDYVMYSGNGSELWSYFSIN